MANCQTLFIPCIKKNNNKNWGTLVVNNVTGASTIKPIENNTRIRTKYVNYGTHLPHTRHLRTLLPCYFLRRDQ